MTFNESCKYLNQNKMKSRAIEKGLVGGEKASVRTYYHPCLSEENPKKWISECPEGCQYFKQK